VATVNERIYTDLAEDYARSSGAGAPNVLYDRPEILRLAGPLAGRDVLELGCGAGHLTRLLVDAGATVTAVDRSTQMVEATRARVPRGASAHVADLEEPLAMVADASVDVVTASLVLHYLPDWRLLLAEVRRCLRPGGRLVLSVHHPITGWLRSDREDYHRVELIEEDWDLDGVPVTAQMWRRPFSAVLTPLLEAGLVVDAVEEPVMEPAAAASIPDGRMRRALTTQPVFLFVRAVRPDRAGYP
jgi:SAM-dependent methyltransferase